MPDIKSFVIHGDAHMKVSPDEFESILLLIFLMVVLPIFHM